MASTPTGRGLLDPTTVRAIAAEIGLRPTKQRGQNFVIDANTVRRIVNLAGVAQSDSVLEIGSGLGSLTLGLLEVAERVTTVEIDATLAGRLPATVAERLPGRAERLRVLCEDALRVRELPDPQPTMVVANLPYNVSVPVLLHLLATFATLQRGLVMVQSEVADRLVALPGSKIYGVPSVKMAWYCRATRVGSVTPSVFWPAPNVDSGLVAMTRTAPIQTTASRQLVFSVIDAAFAQRRKMLRSALAPLCGSSSAASALLERADVDPQMRGETLGVEEFARIAEEVAKASARGPVPRADR